MIKIILKDAKKIFLLLAITLPISAIAEPTVYQAGTFLNLMHGINTGSTTFDTLAKHGDLGLGTVDGLAGEMVEIDDKFYLAAPDGNTRLVAPTEATPFAMVTHFNPQQQFDLQNINSITDLENQIDKHLPSNNLFYVIKVDGKFSYLKARSVKAPSKPYPPLDQVVKDNQNIFDFNDIDGSLIIFKSPEFISPLSVPGYHLHFISADRKKAGHVYDLKFATAKVSVEQVNKFVLQLPESTEYTQANLGMVSGNDITKIENKSN